LSHSQAPEGLAHLFRHEYGSLVASLVRQFGIQRIDLIEDSVQDSMAQALTIWSMSTRPENPSGWLYQVTYKYILSALRKDKRQHTILYENFDSSFNESNRQVYAPLVGQMSDALLRMFFIACHESISQESQLVFTLKSLCGFSVKEISARLFISEANVYKRFNRAKKSLVKQNFVLDEITQVQAEKRMPAVYKVLYLMLTEGYLSSHPDLTIRLDLCLEAERLARILCEHPWGNKPETYALLALIHFNLARIATRENKAGLVLLADQQRDLWDKQKIAQALSYLALSAQGDSISRYHIEASIAAEHCLAESFQKTRWQNIVAAYELLESVAPSPMHRLNRALAVAENDTPEAGLKILEDADIPSWLQRSYHWYAVLADLQYRTNDTAAAVQNVNKAIELAPSQYVKDLLNQRMSRY